MMTRREALKSAAAAAIVCAATPGFSLAQAAPSVTPPGGPFKLPPLPYALDALEPHIDAKTMELHHGKHHAAYVNNLNKALDEAKDLQGMSLEQILVSLDKAPEKVRTTIRNNGGGHYNHSLFWQMLKPQGGGQPTGDLAKAIDKSFGSFSSFKERFTDAGTKLFGSGWVWLIPGPDETLQIATTPNQDSTLMQGAPGAGKGPLLGLDVWEHAYYLKYQNRRPDYINAWFNVINWDFVAERAKTLKG